ncbi:hypothetical protein HK102_011954, partial [Quaeritorhiza haematococci]
MKPRRNAPTHFTHPTHSNRAFDDDQHPTPIDEDSLQKLDSYLSALLSFDIDVVEEAPQDEQDDEKEDAQQQQGVVEGEKNEEKEEEEEKAGDNDREENKAIDTAQPTWQFRLFSSQDECVDVKLFEEEVRHVVEFSPEKYEITSEREAELFEQFESVVVSAQDILDDRAK